MPMSEANLVEVRYRLEATAPARVVIPGAGITAERVTLQPDASYEFGLQGRAHYLALHDIVLRDGEVAVNGGRPIASTDLRGSLTYVPAGMAVHGWSDPGGRRNAFTAIHFEPSVIPESLAQGGAWDEPRIYFNDSQLAATLFKLDRALRRREPFMELLGESLCELAIVELAASRRSVPPIEGRQRALRASDVDRIRQYIRDNLANDITLTEMASVVGLSKSHFCRAYKVATGVTPYHEVLAQRVEAARGMLGRGQSIPIIAVRTGFTDASQFSRTFKKWTGVTPSAFARLWR